MIQLTRALYFTPPSIAQTHIQAPLKQSHKFRVDLSYFISYKHI